MAQFELAVAEKPVQKLFETLRDGFSESASGSGNFGPFTASYAAGAKLKNGRIEFQSNGTVLVKELDIVYDPLKLTLGIDIPPVTIGGFCIIPTPWGCALKAPKKTFFSGNPDISATLDLGGIITTEISATCSFKLGYWVNPASTGMSRWDAYAIGQPNEWRLFLDPGWIDIDIIDIADTAGNLIDKLIDKLVDDLLGFLPDWARDLVKKILGSLGSLIRKILDLTDDIDEWLSNLFGVSFGLFDFIAEKVLDYFAARNAIFSFQDPYPIMGPVALPNGGPVLVPVLAPIVGPAVSVNDDEMVISASIGA